MRYSHLGGMRFEWEDQRVMRRIQEQGRSMTYVGAVFLVLLAVGIFLDNGLLVLGSLFVGLAALLAYVIYEGIKASRHH